MDDWIAQHANQAAVWLAAEQELARRREIAVADQVDRAVIDPPAHVRDVIGDPPELASAHRPEWESLARRLEHARLITQATIADGSDADPDPAARHDVERRVRHLRENLGFAPASRSRDLGIER